MGVGFINVEREAQNQKGHNLKLKNNSGAGSMIHQEIDVELRIGGSQEER